MKNNIPINYSEYETSYEAVLKTQRDDYPNSMEVFVPENQESKYINLFSGRSEYDLDLLIKGY